MQSQESEALQARYRLACERAAAAAARQRGALLRQADLVRDMLAALP